MTNDTASPVNESKPDLVRCPSCLSPAVAGDRFCEACGHDLSVPVAPCPPPPAVATCVSCRTEGEMIDGYCGVCGLKQPSARDHLERSWPGVGAITDKGFTHHENQDAFAVAPVAAWLAAVVSDGVSTTVEAATASQAAVDAAVAVLAASGPDQPDFAGAFAAARQAVLAVPFQPHPELGPPSCTYLAAAVNDGAITLSSLGDCRSFWVDGGGVRQLTTDDSWAHEMIASGELSTDEAYADPRGHSITRWIAHDADAAWSPTQTSFVPPGPGRLLLVSDGLWNYTLEPDRVLDAMGDRTADALTVARAMVDFAKSAGGHDNITVVVVDLPLTPARGGTASP